MRVFLDIGSHIGESVHEVAQAKYGFDRIVCFEPAGSCLPALERLRAADPRVEICPFGLSDRTGEIELHDAGTLGGSVFASEGPVETIKLADAGEWFASNLAEDDFVVVKTNCEGSEVDIVNSLLDRGLMTMPVTFLITFDIRNYRDHRHKEAEVRNRLKAAGVDNVCFSDDVMIGTTHEKRLAHWLGLFGIDEPQKSKRELRSERAGVFRHYASKTGRRQRIESRMKELLSYSSLPDPVKNLFRAIKRAAGLSRERDA